MEDHPQWGSESRAASYTIGSLFYDPPGLRKLWQNKPSQPPKEKKRHLDPKRRVIGPVETDQRGAGKLPFRAI